VCGDARGNNGPINPRRLEAQRGLEYVLRIGRLARLGPSSDQVLSKSVTGTTRRCECRLPICWTSRKLAMDLGDSTNDADSCRMLVAKGAAPSRTGLCWLPSRRKDNRACMSSAVQPLRGPDGPGTRVRETRVAGTHDAASLIGRAEVMAASLITPPKPIITRSGGWVRPETWTIHGSSGATGERRRPHGYNRPLLHLGQHFSSQQWARCSSTLYCTAASTGSSTVPASPGVDGIDWLACPCAYSIARSPSFRGTLLSRCRSG
jgi:hypothetical protein